MTSLVVMDYDYDRRRIVAAKPMSDWLWKLLGKIAQAHKTEIDRIAEQAGRDVYTAEELVRKHPDASDDELAKQALAGFSFNWSDIIEDRESGQIIMKWVTHVISKTSANPDEDVSVEMRGDVLEVKTRGWGTTYEYDEDDPWGRVEVPALEDMHNHDIERLFKTTGAEVDSDWKLVDDPNGYSADALVFPTTIRWHLDEAALSKKFGEAAFEKAFKDILPEARREVAANPRHPAPAAPPPARRKRR